MKKKRRPYPLKYRSERAQKAREHKPWAASTGPRTPQGKAIASQNALKSGLYTPEIKALRAALSRHRKILRDLVNLDV